MTMKQWNVRVVRNGYAAHIGQVAESNETLARCLRCQCMACPRTR